MREKKIIGGEYRIETDALQGGIIRNAYPRYSLGRTCLFAILDTLKTKIEGVLLPDYLCGSVAEVPIRIGLQFERYHITSSLLPDVEELKKTIQRSRKNIAIVLISYFGVVDLDNVITIIRSDYPEVMIIVDDVQNFYGFGDHCDYDFCFTSYRKWFAVPDGADILKKPGTPELQYYDRQGGYVLYKTAGNILKNHIEMIGDSISLELIEKGEKQMDEEYRYTCSDIGSKLFQRINTGIAAEKRRKNAMVLHNGLERLGIKHYYDSERIPLFVPIIVHNRDMIRRKLFAEKIFVPIHWPLSDADMQGTNELYQTELSLICDQRYDEEDMERILRGIENAM